MKNEIVKTELTALQCEEIENTMYNLLKESIKSLDESDYKGMLWYKSCEFEDYFTELAEIWDEGEFVGYGIDTIARKFVLNDETRADFEQAFENAREQAFAESIRELYEDKVVGANNFKEFEKIGRIDENANVDGYKFMCEDNAESSYFDDSALGGVYSAMQEYFDVDLDKLLAFAGATAVYRDYDDYRKIYYKKIEKNEGAHKQP